MIVGSRSYMDYNTAVVSWKSKTDASIVGVSIVSPSP